MNEAQLVGQPKALVNLIAWCVSRRYLILVTTVAVTLGCIGVTYFISPQYQATAILVSVSTGSGSGSVLSSTLSQLGGLSGLGAIAGGSRDADAEEALAVLRSRSFLEGYIADEHLLPVIYSEAWDASREGWKLSGNSVPTLAKASKRFRDQIMVIKQDRRTGLTSLQVTWSDSAGAASWANGLIKRLNAEMRVRARDKAERSIAFLQQELSATTDISSRAALNRLMEAQVTARFLNTAPYRAITTPLLGPHSPTPKGGTTSLTRGVSRKA